MPCPKCTPKCSNDSSCCKDPTLTKVEWAEIAERYGDETARIVGDALALGFSPAAIKDILELFVKKEATKGKPDIFGRKPLVFGEIPDYEPGIPANTRFGDSPIIQGDGSDPTAPQTINPAIFVLIEQLAATLLTTYGPQIIAWLLQQLTTTLQTPSIQQQINAAFASLPPVQPMQ